MGKNRQSSAGNSSNGTSTPSTELTNKNFDVSIFEKPYGKKDKFCRKMDG